MGDKRWSSRNVTPFWAATLEYRGPCLVEQGAKFCTSPSKPIKGFWPLGEGLWPPGEGLWPLGEGLWPLGEGLGLLKENLGPLK